MTDNITNTNVNNYLNGSYENNLLNELYFSKINIKLLQNKIIRNLKTKYNYIISKQSNDDLIIIMRNTYLSLAKHNYKNKTELKQELNYLNKNTINECCTIIKKNIDNYIFYLNDINTPNYSKKVVPLNIPINTREYNNFEFNKPPH